MSQRVNVNGHIVEFPDAMSDAQIQSAIKANMLQLTKPPEASMMDQALKGGKNLLYGTAKGLFDPVFGVSQLALHGANAAANVFSSGKPLQGITDRYDQLLKDGEEKYQADTKGSIAAGVGRFGMNMLIPIKGAAGLTGVPAVVNGIKTGTALATAQPVFETQDDYAGKKGAQIAVGAGLGGALPVAGNVAGAMWNSVRPAIMPASTVGDALLKATQKDAGLGAVAPKLPIGQQFIQDVRTGLTGKPPAAVPSVDPVMNLNGLNGNRNAQEVLDRINNRPAFVAGSKPTTAQVVNTPELSMAEKVLSNNPAYKSEMMRQANQNNEARIAALSQVAKTPQELKAAVAERGTATDPLYDAAFVKPYTITPELQAILDRPSSVAALSNGGKIAGEYNKTLNIVPGTPAKSVPTGLLDPAGAPITKDIAATPGTINGQDLQYLKLGINKLIPGDRPNGIAGLSSDAISRTRSDLHNWLRSNAPEYKAADDIYAKMSQPINDMRVGQAVNDVLGTSRATSQLATTAEELALKRNTLNSAGDTSLTLNNVHTAIKKALDEEGHYGITPGAATALDGIKADLQRQSGGASSVTATGSDSVYNLQAPNWLSGKIFGNDLSGAGNAMPAVVGALTTMGDLIGGMGVGSSLGIGGLVTGSAKKAAQFVGNRVNTQYQKAMADPDYYAKLLQQSLDQGGGLLNNVGATAAQGSIMGGLLNAR